jgi:hypothetical protein
MAIKRTKSRFKGAIRKKDERNADYISKQHNKSKKELGLKKRSRGQTNRQFFLTKEF